MEKKIKKFNKFIAINFILDLCFKLFFFILFMLIIIGLTSLFILIFINIKYIFYVFYIFALMVYAWLIKINNYENSNIKELKEFILIELILLLTLFITIIIIYDINIQNNINYAEEGNFYEKIFNWYTKNKIWKYEYDKIYIKKEIMIFSKNNNIPHIDIEKIIDKNNVKFHNEVKIYKNQLNFYKNQLNFYKNQLNIKNNKNLIILLQLNDFNFNINENNHELYQHFINFIKYEIIKQNRNLYDNTNYVPRIDTNLVINNTNLANIPDAFLIDENNKPNIGIQLKFKYKNFKNIMYLLDEILKYNEGTNILQYDFKGDSLNENILQNLYLENIKQIERINENQIEILYKKKSIKILDIDNKLKSLIKCEGKIFTINFKNNNLNLNIDGKALDMDIIFNYLSLNEELNNNIQILEKYNKNLDLSEKEINLLNIMFKYEYKENLITMEIYKDFLKNHFKNNEEIVVRNLEPTPCFKQLQYYYVNYGIENSIKLNNINNVNYDNYVNNINFVYNVNNE